MKSAMEIKIKDYKYEVNGFCELTDEMDKYLVLGKNEYRYTYIYGTNKNLHKFKHEDGYSLAIRVPGATRGCILVNNDDIITEIVFYEDSCYDVLKCFDRRMEEIKDKYIGRKIIYRE